MKITCKGLEVKVNVSVEARVDEISEVSESKKVSKDSERMSSDDNYANDVEIKAGFNIGFGAEEYSGEIDLLELTKMINGMIKTNVTDEVTNQVQEQITHKHKETESNTSSEKPMGNLHGSRTKPEHRDYRESANPDNDSPEEKLRGWDEI